MLSRAICSSSSTKGENNEEEEAGWLYCTMVHKHRGVWDCAGGEMAGWIPEWAVERLRPPHRLQSVEPARSVLPPPVSRLARRSSYAMSVATLEPQWDRGRSFTGGHLCSVQEHLSVASGGTRPAGLRVRRDIVGEGAQLLQQVVNSIPGFAEATCIALFDKHGVVDQLTLDEAVRLGAGLGRVPFGICSYGKNRSHRAEVFHRSQQYWPFVSACDFVSFTDSPSGHVEGFYMESYHRGRGGRALCWRGDKSCWSRAVGVPTILFDDRDDVLAAHAQGHPDNVGILVTFGHRSRHGHRLQPRQLRWEISHDPAEWPARVEAFGARVRDAQHVAL